MKFYETKYIKKSFSFLLRITAERLRWTNIMPEAVFMEFNKESFFFF